MSNPAETTPVVHPHLSVVSRPTTPEPALSAEDRAEIGVALVDLLCDLHWSGALRPRWVDGVAGQSLEIALVVPGTGDVLVQISQVAGVYELAISGALWQDLVVSRETDGRLGALYGEYFCSQAHQEKAAKDLLLQGFNQLRLVKTWGVHHQSAPDEQRYGDIGSVPCLSGRGLNR
ncbi:MAG: hypothetical protein ABSA91_03140 [Acidimicrobiales bacterium]|jgi:hypothetical protein